MGASPYVRIGHVDLFQIVELHNSMSREGSKTDRLKPPNDVGLCILLLILLRLKLSDKLAHIGMI